MAVDRDFSGSNPTSEFCSVQGQFKRRESRNGRLGSG